MRARLAARAASVFFAILLISCRDSTPQPPQHSPASVYDLFNQEAGVSDPSGVRKYAVDLIDLLMPSGVSDETRHEVISALADRLTRAEEGARGNRRKLIPEASVVGAYNELMSAIGAPSSLRTTEEPVRQFRAYAASFKAFPALFTADRNGASCNPGEAVYLLYLLLWTDGKPSKGDLYSAWVKQQPGDQRHVPPQPNDKIAERGAMRAAVPSGSSTGTHWNTNQTRPLSCSKTQPINWAFEEESITRTIMSRAQILLIKLREP